jgi:hypothetical protein
MRHTDFERDLYDLMLLEAIEGVKANRAQFIKDKLGPHWKDGLPGYKDMDKWLEKVAAVDPSLKGIYMQWIARMSMGKPNENRTEDLDRVGEDLRAFETNKAKITNKDINAYKSFQELFDVIAPFLVKAEPTKDEKAKAKEAAELEKVKKDIITVYTGPDGWIRIPTTVAAAIFLGQNTRWCTSARGNNMFAHYNKSDSLFVVYDKATKTRSQLHLDSGQFAGEDDRNKGVDAVPQWARKPILDWYRSNNPQLSLKHIFAMKNFTDENLAKGTPHEGIMDLMKLYNVK